VLSLKLSHAAIFYPVQFKETHFLSQHLIQYPGHILLDPRPLAPAPHAPNPALHNRVSSHRLRNPTSAAPERPRLRPLRHPRERRRLRPRTGSLQLVPQANARAQAAQQAL
jgi:hypothetical protein